MYRLTEEQQGVVARASAIAATVMASNAARVDSEGAFPQESLDALAQAGFWGLTISPEFGGMGQGPRVMAAVLDEIAQQCASTAMVYMMHLCGVAAYSAAPGKTAPYLTAAAEGKHLSTLAWSEFGSRSHFWAPVSQARQQDGRVSVTAAKSFVTSAGQADGYVVSTRATAAASPTESTIYLVLRDDPGLRVAAQWDGLGMRGNGSGPMNLQNVALTAERALSEEGQGLGLMLNPVLPFFNLGNAAVSIGIAEAAFKAAQHHVSTARFDYTGERLADLPNERARLAQMRIAVDQARAHLVSAIDAVEQPGPATLLLVLESKAAAAETAAQVTDMALRACGGTGFSKNLGLERNFRDARAALVMGPTTDVLYDFIGRALCGMEVF